MAALLVVMPNGPSDALFHALEARGHSVQHAQSVSDAVDSATRSLPDAILLDASLPELDRARAIRKLGEGFRTASIPVLVFPENPGKSSLAPFEAPQRLLARIDLALGVHTPSAQTVRMAMPRDLEPEARPTRTARLRATVTVPPASMATAPPASMATAPPASMATVPPASMATAPPASMATVPASMVDTSPPAVLREARRILVVDDHPMNRDVIVRRLQRHGFEIEAVDSGPAALAAVDRQRFDLVLLDWMMPGMSGIEVLRTLRSRHPAIELPIIMVTARSDADDVVEALKAEANDYVTKPLHFEVVLARIKTHLSLTAAHRALAETEARYRALLDNTVDLVAHFDVSGAVRYVSPASRALVGFEPDALAAKSFFDWFHPRDAEALATRHLAGPFPPALTFVARMACADGGWRWVETRWRLLRSAGSLSVLASCRDVHDQVEATAGERPPAPLGRDLEAHPGWRTAGVGTNALPEAPVTAGLPPPVVVTVVVGKMSSGIKALSRQVSEALEQALEGGSA